jgi:organic hydroperoxide reductase OsmC/OhrA
VRRPDPTPDALGGAQHGHNPYANTHWEGNLLEAKGTVSLSSSNIGTYDRSGPARSEEPGGKTSFEELIAAAHSSCYSMAFGHGLAGKGYTVASLDTKADVTFQPGEGNYGDQANGSRLRSLPVAGGVPDCGRGRQTALAVRENPVAAEHGLATWPREETQRIRWIEALATIQS